MQRVRDALFRWMRDVMEERGWSAAAWARYAEVTPTNLTRFLRDPATASVPSAETIGKLAWAAGSEPRFLSDGKNVEVCRIPILTLDQVRTLLTLSRRRIREFLHQAARADGHCVVLERRSSPCAYALRISSLHMNAGGLLPEDQIVVEPVDLLPPRPGNLVVAIDGESVCGYRYYPPYLVPASTDAACCPVTCDRAMLAGVAVHVARPLFTDEATQPAATEATQPMATAAI